MLPPLFTKLTDALANKADIPAFKAAPAAVYVTVVTPHRHSGA
jgi:hypothetical protein